METPANAKARWKVHRWNHAGSDAPDGDETEGKASERDDAGGASADGNDAVSGGL